MGARGSSLVGKAVVDEKLMPYTSYGKRDILEVRLRHLHDLGGRYGFGACVPSPWWRETNAAANIII